MRLNIDIDTRRIRNWLTHLFRVEIVYSLDEKKFYAIGRTNERPRDWLSIEKGDDGKYEALPFAFWKVRSGRHEWVRRSHPLAVLYRDLYNNFEKK